MNRSRPEFSTLLLALLLAACTGTGDAGGGDAEPRTIEVSMTDELRFDPDQISTVAGERVRFEITNEGQIVHEFLIGDEAAQAQFEADMAAEGMDHDSDAGIRLAPGQTDSFDYTFGTAGTALLAGCHEPGHYDGGMVASISVTQ